MSSPPIKPVATRPPDEQTDINDIVQLVLLLTGRYPSHRDAWRILARLQPNGPWQRMLDQHEEIRLDGIRRKMKDGSASDAERADHRQNRPVNEAIMAAHRAGDIARSQADKGGE